MPKLIVIRDGRHYPHPFHSKTLNIGYGPENDLVLEDDPEVSSDHCRIFRRGSEWTAEDVGSRNGTYLNGSMIRRARLNPGDKLRVGQTVLLFTGDDETQGDQRRLQNLSILQEINKALNSETNLDRLLQLIMDMAVHLTTAERGFLVLVSDGVLDFRVARNIEHGVVELPEFETSKTVVQQVVNSGQAMLTSNAQQDLSSIQSIVSAEVRSLLCVPLKVKNKVLGVLYVDSRSRKSTFDEDDRSLLLGFSDQAAIALENARLIAEVRQTEAMRSELRVASTIQHALLPKAVPQLAGFEVAGAMLTAKEVGGDYYDYILPPMPTAGAAARGLYLVIGDVSGKGVPAGLVMVMARSVLRSLASSWDARPSALLTETNRILKPDLKPGIFMSMLLARINPGSGTCTVSGCGHERPLVFRAEKRNVQAFDAGGIVLGVVPEIGSMVNDMEIKLELGDQLVLYTDGVTEAMDADRNQYSIQRLMETIHKHGERSADELVAAIGADVNRHRGEAEIHDDITLLVLRRVR